MISDAKKIFDLECDLNKSKDLNIEKSELIAELESENEKLKVMNCEYREAIAKRNSFGRCVQQPFTDNAELGNEQNGREKSYRDVSSRPYCR